MTQNSNKNTLSRRKFCSCMVYAGVAGMVSCTGNDTTAASFSGTTKATASSYGYVGEMKLLTKQTAFDIYSKMYWDINLLDDIEKILGEDIAGELADTGINMGSPTAANFLQRSLNVLNNRQKHYEDLKIDGEIGDKTLSICKSYSKLRGAMGETVLYRALNCLQGAGYVDLCERREKDEKFIFGWFKHRASRG